MSFRTLAALAGVLVPAAVAAAGPVVTLYSHDLGLVRETRAFDLADASQTVRLEDVSTGLDFSSVRFVPSSGRLARLAFRFDVASGSGLIERALGERVRVASKDNRVTEGTLLSADGEWLVVRTDDAGVSTLARSAVEEVRLAKPSATMSLKPALEAVIEGGRKGRASADLMYLTAGLSWSAEHLLVRTGETTAQWSASVSLVNTTGRDYVDASIKLIAGDPQRSGGMPSPRPMMMKTMAMSAEGMAAGDMSEAAFADYHLYTLGQPATLRDRETQRLTMIEPKNVTVKPRYLYRGGDPRGVQSQLELVNSTAAGPGVPLPGGRVRFYQADADKDVQFTGETAIGHTPVDEKLTLDVGTAFDLAAERRETANRRISDRERELSVEIKLRNRKTSDVTIVVEEPIGGDAELTAQSYPSTKKDANTFRFEIKVPAGKETVLTYTARVRY